MESIWPNLGSLVSKFPTEPRILIFAGSSNTIEDQRSTVQLGESGGTRVSSREEML